MMIKKPHEAKVNRQLKSTDPGGTMPQHHSKNQDRIRQRTHHGIRRTGRLKHLPRPTNNGEPGPKASAWEKSQAIAANVEVICARGAFHSQGIMPHAIKGAESGIRIPDLPERKTNHISIPQAVTQEADAKGENAITHISRWLEFDDHARAAQAGTKREHKAPDTAPITERVKVAHRARSDSSPSV